MAGAAGPVRRADLHAVHPSIAPRHADRGVLEAIEDARSRRRARPRDRAALDLRHPRRGRAGGGRGDAAASPCDHAPDALVGFGLGGPEIGVPRPQFKPHFDRGARGRAAQRAARRARPPARRPSGTRCATSAPSGSATAPRRVAGPRAAGLPRRAPHPARGLPDLQHRHPRGRAPRRAPDPAAASTPGSWSRSTATTRRCSAPRSTGSTRSPPAARPRRDGRRRAGPERRAASFLPASDKARVLAEIDAYAAANAEEADGERHRR